MKVGQSHSSRGVPRRNLKRILIVRLSSLGDVIQTLPVPSVVRQAYPDAEIGWAIDRELAPAISGHPDLNHVHECDRLKWGRALKNPGAWRRTLTEGRSFIDDIRAVGYDCALDVQGLLKSAVIPFLAGIPSRIGFAHRRELSHFFYTERYLTRTDYFDHSRMHIDHMMALAQAIGCGTDYRVQLPPAAPDTKAKIEALLHGAIATGPIVAFAPATQWKSKKWPFEHWLSLTRMTLKQTSASILLIGAAADASLTARLVSELDQKDRPRVVDLCGSTSIVDLYALFERVSTVVAADTAPLHIAGAAGCDLIGLFGATPVLRTGPMGQGNITLMSAQPRLACQPCQERVCRYGTTACMQNLSPREVFDAVSAALGSARASSRDAKTVAPQR